MKRKTVLMTCILLLVCFAVILLMQYFQTYMNELRGDEFVAVSGLKTGFNLIMSTIIVTVNVLLSKHIHSYVQMERRKSYSNYCKSVASYLSVSMFFNTALIYFVINNMLLNYSIDQKGALINDIVYLMITNALIPPILSIIDIWHIRKLY